MRTGAPPAGLGQLEGDVNQGGVIHRMPVFFRGLKPDLFGDAFCRLIETMPQPVYYAQYLDLASRQKAHLQSYLTLDAQLSGFRSVLRVRFGDHDRGNKGRFVALD